MNNISISPEAEKTLMNNVLDHYTGPIIGRCTKEEAIEGFKKHLEVLEQEAGEKNTGYYQIIFSIQVIPSDLLPRSES